MKVAPHDESTFDAFRTSVVPQKHFQRITYFEFQHSLRYVSSKSSSLEPRCAKKSTINNQPRFQILPYPVVDLNTSYSIQHQMIQISWKSWDKEEHFCMAQAIVHPTMYPCTWDTDSWDKSSTWLVLVKQKQFLIFAAKNPVVT